MTCLLAIDVGNTNTVVGVYRDRELIAHWRIQTDTGRTADEYAVLTRGLFALDQVMGDLDATAIGHGIISSVVPPAIHGLRQFFRRHLGTEPLVVGPGIKTGMPILYESPRRPR